MGLGRGRRATAFISGACALAALAVPGPAAAADPGWAQRALAGQYELGSDLPFVNTPWVGTHNSFNSIAEMGLALSVLDSNQRIDLTAQLDAGIRSLELDVHKFLTAGDGIGFRPVVCHARSADEGHLGCTIEKPLRPVLREIAGWLRAPANRDQVLLLYLEDHLQDAEGFDAGADVVRDELGDLVYMPPAGGCTEVPDALTRHEVRAAGNQVLIVSDCGVGTGWPAVAFNWDGHVENRPFGYLDYPDCGPDYDRATYDSALVRYYEDSTFLTAGTGRPDDGITPPTAAAMARCGVDLVGLDQLTGPGDPRLESLVWSWAPNRPTPRAGGRRCALQVAASAAGRAAWFDRSCARRRRPACVDAAGSWRVLAKPRRRRDAARACERRGLALGTPRTGFEAQRLAGAMARAGAHRAWLSLRRSDAAWPAP